MSGRRRSGRKRAAARKPEEEFWGGLAPPPVATAIRPAADPTAVIRSLGPPPLPGQQAAEQEIAKVAIRASGLATALAMANDILAAPDGDQVEDPSG